MMKGVFMTMRSTRVLLLSVFVLQGAVLSAGSLKVTSTCPLSKRTAVGTSIVSGVVVGGLVVHSGLFQGVVAGGLVGGGVYWKLSQYTPEYQYAAAEKIITTTINDVLLKDDLSDEAFYKEIGIRFIGNSWPLVDGHIYLSDELRRANAAGAILVAIMKECSDTDYHEVRAGCRELLELLAPLNDVVEARLQLLLAHKDYERQEERQKEAYEREMAESQRVTAQNQKINSYFNIANSGLDLFKDRGPRKVEIKNSNVGIMR